MFIIYHYYTIIINTIILSLLKIIIKYYCEYYYHIIVKDASECAPRVLSASGARGLEIVQPILDLPRS